MKNHDVIIIGAGPGGSTLATFLAQSGVDVAIVEKDQFPRFKIGESLLPYSMQILQASGAFDIIDQGSYTKKFGAQFVDWRQPQAEVHFEFKNGLEGCFPYAFEVDRSLFDQDLLNHARSRGVKVYQPENVASIQELENGVEVKTSNSTYFCRYLVDASGRSAFLGRTKKMRTSIDEFSKRSLYCHFKGVTRLPGLKEGDIIIGSLAQRCWSWMIPLHDDTTSVGIVFDPEFFKTQSSQLNHQFILETLSKHPVLNGRVKNASASMTCQTTSNYSGTCEKLIGPRWILVGDAASFLDPVFSSGVHISLQSTLFAHKTIMEAMKSNEQLPNTTSGSLYEENIHKGINRFKSLLRLFYDTDFVSAMQKVKNRPNILQAFTSVVGGDVWNDENILFKTGVL